MSEWRIGELLAGESLDFIEKTKSLYREASDEGKQWVMEFLENDGIRLVDQATDRFKRRMNSQ